MTQGGDRNGGKAWYIKNGVRGFDLSTLPRCQAIAKTTDKRCKNPAMKGHKVCSIHGGVYMPGAPKGNRNSWKHGLYSAAAIAERKAARAMLKDSADMLDGLCGILTNNK